MSAPDLSWDRLPTKIKALCWLRAAKQNSAVAGAAYAYVKAALLLKSAQNNTHTTVSTIPFSDDFSYISLYGTSAVLSQTTPTGDVMTFQIEDGVPVPKRAAGRTGSKYPFGRLEVGQSFMVPVTQDPEDEGSTVEKRVGTLRSAIGAFCKRNPGHGKFSVRLVEGGVRVWRTE